MSKYRDELPQLGQRLFLTDGGLETTLIFHERLDLPYFAAFDLLRDAAGWGHLRQYYERYLKIADDQQLGFVLESPTWRANPDWGRRIGYDANALVDVNHKAIELMQVLRETHEKPGREVVISGNIGPRGDGYRPDERMTAEQARAYHGAQTGAFAESAADMVSAFTINYVEEAIGIVQAARDHGLPVAISFTVETDGRLITGESLSEAIGKTDEQTGGYCAYYMINCAHPTHFGLALADNAGWVRRIRGLRANASCRSHAELDEAEDLDDGNPTELGEQCQALRELLPHLTVLGGCCGTDHRHIAAIAAGCLQNEASAA